MSSPSDFYSGDQTFKDQTYGYQPVFVGSPASGFTSSSSSPTTPEHPVQPSYPTHPLYPSYSPHPGYPVHHALQQQAFYYPVSTPPQPTMQQTTFTPTNYHMRKCAGRDNMGSQCLPRAHPLHSGLFECMYCGVVLMLYFPGKAAVLLPSTPPTHGAYQR